MRIFTVFNRTPRKRAHGGWTAYTLSDDGYTRMAEWTYIDGPWETFSRFLVVPRDSPGEEPIYGRATPWRTARDR